MPPRELPRHFRRAIYYSVYRRYRRAARHIERHSAAAALELDDALAADAAAAMTFAADAGCSPPHAVRRDDWRRRFLAPQVRMCTMAQDRDHFISRQRHTLVACTARFWHPRQACRKRRNARQRRDALRFHANTYQAVVAAHMLLIKFPFHFAAR